MRWGQVLFLFLVSDEMLKRPLLSGRTQPLLDLPTYRLRA
jgi:hypothetical protein